MCEQKLIIHGKQEIHFYAEEQLNNVSLLI